MKQETFFVVAPFLVMITLFATGMFWGYIWGASKCEVSKFAVEIEGGGPIGCLEVYHPSNKTYLSNETNFWDSYGVNMTNCSIDLKVIIPRR